MTRIAYNIATLLAIVLLGGVIYGSIKFAYLLPLDTITLSSALNINVLFVGLCAIVCTIIIRSAIKSNNKYNLPNRVERGATYKRFVDYFYSGLPMDDGWYELTSHMTLWAPDTVLKHYVALIKMLEEKVEPQLIQRKAELVIREMRRDWGYSNWGLLMGDLVNTANRFELDEQSVQSDKNKEDVHDEIAVELENFKVAQPKDFKNTGSINGVMH